MKKFLSALMLGSMIISGPFNLCFADEDDSDENPRITWAPSIQRCGGGPFASQPIGEIGPIAPIEIEPVERPHTPVNRIITSDKLDSMNNPATGRPYTWAPCD